MQVRIYVPPLEEFAPLYTPHPDRSGARDAYLQINSETGRVRWTSDACRGALSRGIASGVVRLVRCSPLLTSQQIHDLSTTLGPLIQRFVDCSEQGGARFEAAEETLDDIDEYRGTEEPDLGESDARNWLDAIVCRHRSETGTVERISIGKRYMIFDDTPDWELRMLEIEVQGLARDEEVVLFGTFDALAALREECE